MRVFLLLLLIVAIAVGTYVGCDGTNARVGVAKDKVLAKIDAMLGKLDVKLKKVENAYAELEAATDGQREKRIEAKVRLERLQEQSKALETEKSELVGEIRKVKPLLEEAQSDGEIERNGRKISVDELKGFAEDKMKRVKSIDDQLNNRIKTLTNAYATSLDAIQKNEKTSAIQLKKLDEQIEEIRSKKAALYTMKEASSIVGPGESLSDKFDDLTKDVDDLLVDVDVELATEIEKIDERTAAIEQPGLSLEELLDDKTDATGTVDAIDALLKSQGDQ